MEPQATPALPAAPRTVAPAIALGSLEAFKWLGLVLMTLDHAERYLWHSGWAGWDAMGRMALPLFGFVLASRLAQLRAGDGSVRRRMMLRMALSGVCAMPAIAWLAVLAAGWWPLNVMFTLLAAVAIIDRLDAGGARGSWQALAIAVAAGPLVEFFWFGLAYVVASWRYCRHPGSIRRAHVVLATASLVIVNGNAWAFAALPLLFAGSSVRLRIARPRAHFFYVYYPLHFALLGAAAWAMQHCRW